MDLAEAFVSTAYPRRKEHCAADLDLPSVDKDLMTRLDFGSTPFQRCSYTEAAKSLEKSGKTWEHPVAWGANLQAEHERYLTEEHSSARRRSTLSARSSVLHAARTTAPRRARDRAAMDLLVPGIGEIIAAASARGGSTSLRAGMRTIWMRSLLVVSRPAPLRQLRTPFLLRAHAHVVTRRHIRASFPFARTRARADF